MPKWRGRAGSWRRREPSVRRGPAGAPHRWRSARQAPDGRRAHDPAGAGTDRDRGDQRRLVPARARRTVPQLGRPHSVHGESRLPGARPGAAALDAHDDAGRPLHAAHLAHPGAELSPRRYEPLGLSPHRHPAPRSERGAGLSGRTSSPSGRAAAIAGRVPPDRQRSARAHGGRGGRRADLRGPSAAGGVGRVGHRPRNAREQRALPGGDPGVPPRGSHRASSMEVVGRDVGGGVCGRPPREGPGDQSAGEPADPRRLPSAPRRRPLVDRGPREDPVPGRRRGGGHRHPVRAQPRRRVEPACILRSRRAALALRVQPLVLSDEHGLAGRADAPP